ncbi:MAG: hypothetical protein JJE25_01215, partial [Bacteroidia bacterium]|nr:hypothetical protein [Bacteroidia bacterium]
MKRKISYSALFFLFLFYQFTYAQTTFQKLIYAGSSSGNCIRKTFDDGFIITAPAIGNNTFGGNDIYLIKLNSNGDTMWTKKYGGSLDDGSSSVQQTSDSGYIVVGATKSFVYLSGAMDVYLIKTNSVGDTLWTRAYERTGYDYGVYVSECRDGGYIIVGNSFSSHGVYDIYILKTNSVGDTLWTKSFYDYTPPFFYNSIYGCSATQAPDSNFIICGADVNRILLFKISNNGNLIWLKSYDTPLYPSQLQQTSDGNFIIFGTSSTPQDIFLLKTDTSGNVIWSKTYGGIGTEGAYTGMQTSDGGYIVTGGTGSFGAGNMDIYLVKTDSAGNLLWSKAYGDTAFDIGRSVVETNDSGFFIEGWSQSFGSNSSLYLIKTDANGNSNCNEVNAGTIVTNINAQLSSRSLFISPLPTFVSNTYPQIASGAQITTLCYTGINKQSAKDNSIKIFPNPNSGVFFIIVNDWSVKSTMTIFNSHGKIVYEEKSFRTSE